MNQSRIRKSLAIAAVSAVGLISLAATGAQAAPRTLVFADTDGNPIEMVVDETPLAAIGSIPVSSVPSGYQWLVFTDQNGDPVVVFVPIGFSVSSADGTTSMMALPTMVFPGADGNPVVMTVANSYEALSVAPSTNIAANVDVPTYVMLMDANGNAVLTPIV